MQLWKKHYIDDARKQNKQEDTISMYLEPTRNDRDYLYGRLLALADRFENGVLYKQGISDTRPTNAVKLMSNFVAKPFTTWGTLWKQLMPYLKSANGAPGSRTAWMRSWRFSKKETSKITVHFHRSFCSVIHASEGSLCVKRKKHPRRAKKTSV